MIRSFLNRIKFSRLYAQGQPRWDTGISPPELLRFLETHPPGRAIDMGCGTGTNVITLAQHGWQATGVDFVKRAVETGERKARQAGVEVDLRVGDVTRLGDVTGPFDLILDIGCYHGLPEARQPAYLDNLERLLGGEGSYLLYVFFRQSPASPLPGVVEADLERIAERLTFAWRKDSLEGQDRPAAWLEFHSQQR